jgi:hypothetical protein
VSHFAEDALGLFSCGFGRPGCTVPPDCEPALAAFLRSIEQDVRDRIALLPPRPKTGNRWIPDGFSGLERPHLSQADSLFDRHCPFRVVLASEHIASKVTQIEATKSKGRQQKSLILCALGESRK